jgi:hypothetical protein
MWLVEVCEVGCGIDGCLMEADVAVVGWMDEERSYVE